MSTLSFLLTCIFSMHPHSVKSVDSSIYSFQIRTATDSVINLSSFQGKKILFVNTASNSQYVGQYASLEQLYQQNKDSLVIIAFPSNDFGNEPGSDSSTQSFVSSEYNIHFILAAKISVTGDSLNPVYQWLTQASLNGVFTNPVGNDFYKFLIDGSGNPIGVFNSTVDPMANDLKNAIND